MRELNFNHDIDYRRLVTALFGDGTETWTRRCVICADHDTDDDAGLAWFPAMEDLECDPNYLGCLNEPTTDLG